MTGRQTMGIGYLNGKVELRDIQMCTHRGWRKRLASRSRQAAQASPKGLLRLPRATESNAAKRYDVECKKILCGLVLQSAGLPTRYSM